MKLIPYDEKAEQAVIGSLLIDNNGLDNIFLSPDNFHHSGHKAIFTAILEITAKGQVADLVTVCDHLTSTGKINKCGGFAYVSSLVDVVISTSSITSYAVIVKEKFIERRIVQESEKVIQAVYDTSIDSKAKLEEAQKSILALSLNADSDTMRSSREIAKTTFAEIEKRHNSNGALIGLPTGITDLDNSISGLIGGDLIILAGRPGMGKSAVAGSIAANVSAIGNTTVIFSLEMPAESYMTRIMASRSGLNSRHLRQGYISNSGWPCAVNATSTISTWPLFIDDKPDITPQEIRGKARKLKKEKNLGLLIVDYMQLIRVIGKHDSREQQVSEISRTLKAIARELNIPVVCLSQLNRQVDGRPDKHPILSDLRESGAIEQDADIIIFAYRDEYYNKSEENPKRGIIELDIAKHRNGETARIEAIFDAKTQTIRNMTKRAA